MRAIVLETFGGPENLHIGEVPKPVPGTGEILVKIGATALNRADILQRKGKYPPPPGESEILGLEIAGTVEAAGPGVTRWKAGDRVCGLLGGGGYAEYATINENLALPVPKGWELQTAAAVPEVFITAFQALRLHACLGKDEFVLIHAGGSGVGTAATQLAREMEAGKIIVTASREKHGLCRSLGADITIDYRTEDFADVVDSVTGGRGVDVVIDFIAAPYFKRNLEVLRTDGRLVMLALLGGAELEKCSLAKLLQKRLHIIGSTLRTRSLEYKIALARSIYDFAWPRFSDGRIKPVIDSVYSWKEAAKAHRYMEENRNTGKIVLTID